MTDTTATIHNHSEFIEALATLPDDIQRILGKSDARAIAERYLDSEPYFSIGRDTCHPVALEGAFEFKEITYEHAEGFAGSALRHGPLALVTENTPVFALFTGASGDAKMVSNATEVQARGAPVIAVAPTSARAAIEQADNVITVPDTHPDVTGVLANVQLQLLSYHAAALLGRPIDKPRNLAKSVTVE